MTEAEILVTLKKLHDLQTEVATALHDKAKTFFEEDSGGIERAFPQVAALEATKSGDFHKALKVLGGAE